MYPTIITIFPLLPGGPVTEVKSIYSKPVPILVQGIMNDAWDQTSWGHPERHHFLVTLKIYLTCNFVSHV